MGGRSFFPRAALLALAAILFPGCDEGRQVRVYVALDRNFSEPILEEFERRTGIEVDAEYDVEAAKTVGLVARIESESARPRCDVFWNNEIMHTIRLQRQGLLEPYASPAAAGLPAEFQDADHHWHGIAARARVFIVNTERLPDRSSWPARAADLVDPRFRGQAAMAKPLTGTTMTHAAVWYATLGPQRTRELLDGIAANEVAMTAGNAHVMRVVRDGAQAFGWTDTDDFNVARVGGFPVAAVYPDQEGEGTLLIPNTIAIVKGAPHRNEAEQLVDFLLSAWVEERLAASDSAQIPLRPGVKAPAHVRMPDTFRAMKVDWAAAAEAYREHQDELRERYVRS